MRKKVKDCLKDRCGKHKLKVDDQDIDHATKGHPDLERVIKMIQGEAIPDAAFGNATLLKSLALTASICETAIANGATNELVQDAHTVLDLLLEKHGK